MLKTKIQSLLPKQYQENYHILQIISFTVDAQVILLEDNISNQKYILKILSSSSYHSNIYELLYEFKDSNLLLPNDILPHENYVYLLYDYYTPLLDYLYNNDFTFTDIINLGVCICKALELLHSKGILYLDFSLGNIYRKNSTSFLLGDFDSSIICSTNSPSYVTPSFAAPELFHPEKLCGFQSDQYSLALLLATLCLNGKIPSLPIKKNHFYSLFPKSFYSILVKATHPKPQNRYSSISEFKNDLLSLNSLELTKVTYCLPFHNPLLTSNKTQEIKILMKQDDNLRHKIKLHGRSILHITLLCILGCFCLITFYYYLYTPKKIHTSISSSAKQVSSSTLHTISSTPIATTPTVFPSNAPAVSTTTPAAISTATPPTSTTLNIQHISCYSLTDELKKQTLDLNMITILLAGENDFTTIDDILLLPNLKELYLNNNHITSLESVSQLSDLQILIVSYNNISNLSPLSSLTNLKTLDLSGNNNIVNFSPLYSLKSLSQLILSDTNISKKQRNQLKKSLPNCELIF